MQTRYLIAFFKENFFFKKKPIICLSNIATILI